MYVIKQNAYQIAVVTTCHGVWPSGTVCTYQDSAVVNGMNLIEDCNPIWGSVIIGTMFLPITIFLAITFVQEFRDNNSSVCKSVWMILLLPLYGPVAIAIATSVFIIYVAYVFARRVVQPSYVSRHIND